jgi:hypothetical protein
MKEIKKETVDCIRKQLAELIVRSYAIENLGMKEPFKIEDVPEGTITQCSVFAVAMEYLGLTRKPTSIDYAKSRGGNIQYTVGEGGIITDTITMRDVLYDSDDKYIEFLPLVVNYALYGPPSPSKK